MIIDNQNIDINDLVSDKYMHKEVKKGIFLSDYQIEVLSRYDINIDEVSSINEIILLASDILELDNDADDLDQVINEISEFNYYTNTNK